MRSRYRRTLKHELYERNGVALPRAEMSKEFNAARAAKSIGPEWASVSHVKFQRGIALSSPVVHFEIIGKDAPSLRNYYTELFGWQFDTNSPVAKDVSEPGNYGFIDRIVTPDGGGIPGGIGGGVNYASHAIFYVGVPNVAAALKNVEKLGGKRVMGPATNPSGKLVVAHFLDPEGNLVGLAGPE
jgi:uncharacterized protein